MTEATDIRTPPQTRDPSQVPGRRLASLDALRGFDMFWILGGSSLAIAANRLSHDPLTRRAAEQLEHVVWEGFHFYDLIFPLFIFIVGVSIVFSLGKALHTGGRAAAMKRVLRRSLLIYCVGVFYYGGFSEPWPEIRLVGVLNRIAVCYFFGSLIFLYCSRRQIVAVCTAILVGYWAAMSFLPFPDVRPVDRNGALISTVLKAESVDELNFASTVHLQGTFEPGVNLASYVDQRYLPGKKWYGTWDPEGLLSTIPAIASCLLGVLAGLFLLSPTASDRRKVVLLVAVGAVGVAAGFAWGLQFPVIKKLWTSSYVLVAGGYSAILLGLFYLFIDVFGFKSWVQPFTWIGMNSITVYLADNLLNNRSVSMRFFGGDIESFLNNQIATGLGDLMIAVGEISITVLIAWFLFKRRLFLRL